MSSANAFSLDKVEFYSFCKGLTTEGADGVKANKQYLLFSQGFLPYMVLIYHFKRTLKCRLQFVSTWTSLKFCRLVICQRNTQQHLYLKKGDLKEKASSEHGFINPDQVNRKCQSTYANNTILGLF